MASEYEYADVADLEALMATDYSGVNAVYTDAVIEAQISSAERKVNGFLGCSFTGTIPDGVKDTTLTIAGILMRNLMIENEEIEGQIEKDVFNDDIKDALKASLSTSSSVKQVWSS